MRYREITAKANVNGVVVEAVAKIGQPWDWSEFGITREQALEAASHLVDLLEGDKGAQARNVIRWWGRGFQKELYDYKTARGWQTDFTHFRARLSESQVEEGLRALEKRRRERAAQAAAERSPNLSPIPPGTEKPNVPR